METRKSLWYSLLTTGKRKLGWKDGLSIPFLVGAYSQKRENDYGSLEGLKEIFEEIKTTIGTEEIGIVKCNGYKTMDVYMIQVLSDIAEGQARIVRENQVFEDRIYTTLADVSSFNSLVEKLWDMYKDPIMKGNFSVQNDFRGDHWRPFNGEELTMIGDL